MGVQPVKRSVPTIYHDARSTLGIWAAPEDQSVSKIGPYNKNQKWLSVCLSVCLFVIVVVVADDDEDDAAALIENCLI